MEKSAPKYDTCFFERYAQTVLSTLFGADYECLINLDRPDLQSPDYKIGIEVTRAMIESKAEATNLLNDMAQKEVVCPAPMAEKSRTAAYTYGLADSVGSIEYDYWLNASPLPKVLENKVKKVLSGFYGDFEQQQLFVYTRQAMHREDIINALSHVIHLQEDKMGFSTLYIFDIQTLWQCDITTMSINPHHISPAMCQIFFNKAINK